MSNLEGADDLMVRRRTSMALVVVGQMLPEGAIKGGSGMALRYGRNTRFTRDLDAARIQPLAQFRSDFEESLATGWSGLTGRLLKRAAPKPVGVPTPYVMQSFDVKLDYRGRSWCTVKFELGHNEIGDADEPDYQLLDNSETLDLAQVAKTCTRLFNYRQQQTWPPTIVPGANWGILYEAAAEDLNVLPTAQEAVIWANRFIQRIETSLR